MTDDDTTGLGQDIECGGEAVVTRLLDTNEAVLRDDVINGRFLATYLIVDFVLLGLVYPQNCPLAALCGTR